MNKIIFEKRFERDTTLILQALWARDLLGDNYLGFGKENPHSPFWILYFTNENAQMWVNRLGMKWFTDSLLERNRADAMFIQAAIKDQQKTILELKSYWDKKDALSSEEVVTYFTLIKRAMTNITLYYLSGLDDRTPEFIKNNILTMRKMEEDLETLHKNFVHTTMGAKGYSEKYANVLLPEEFLNTPTEKELESRLSGIVVEDGKKFFVGSLLEYAEIHLEFEFIDLKDVHPLSTTVVKGQVAQKGKVVGRVRIVKNREQANQVKEGEVIVSSMTTPQFIVGMHKASAFVTDEGGIVCHAAIVAREMKKPCIIGTKIGSKIFKTGDLVEVDANQGVVTILERAIV